MPRLFRLIAPVAIAAALGLSVPAQAATPARANAIRAQISQLEAQVSRNDGRGRVSQREAYDLQRDVRKLQSRFYSYNRNGLSNSEMRTLESQIQAIRARLGAERRDDNRWRR
ncbi:hypothetical protein ACOYW6_03055 [Parablastomonas sp. CN1-191]|uniref:hypothetical protein n=1 Tax=Parablastomonas sp. CN1-191 TaxID=3400908 RepID=UPI003BF7CAE9